MAHVEEGILLSLAFLIYLLIREIVCMSAVMPVDAVPVYRAEDLAAAPVGIHEARIPARYVIVAPTCLIIVAQNLVRRRNHPADAAL